MITFFIALILLIGGYILYSRVTEKAFGIDDRLTPAMSCPDGVDITPLPRWKAFLIELLNIAGTGPIFGAVSGALFGPVVFIWIVIGCIFGGAVHDYFTGMISSRNNGGSIVMMGGKYIGKVAKIILSIFSIVLLLLVTAVFVVSPASLLESLCGGKVKAWVFLIIILAYYLLATLLPIDKIIGKAYPLFGIILVVMALAVIIGIMVKGDSYPMLELVGSLKDFSAENGGLPWWPFMFTTVACGAVSGFHASQSPMMAKCIKCEKDGRKVFYGAMVAEGIIALIWAAAAMAFFRTNTQDGWNVLTELGGGNSTTVYEISKTVLGGFGSVLAVIGVIVCPITSGDTALRSLRLIIGELFKVNQKSIKNRLFITIPLFAIITGISIWNFLDVKNFNILWRWFAWSNQTLAAVALWVCTSYSLKYSKNKYWSLITAIPMSFMIAVVVTYIFGEPQIALGRVIPVKVAYIIGGVFGAISLVIYFICLIRKKQNEQVLEEGFTS